MDERTLAGIVEERFSTWAEVRKTTREDLWNECYNNFMGRYDPALDKYKSDEGKGSRSRMFVRATARTIRTAYAKMDAPLRMYDYNFEPDWAAMVEAGFDREDEESVARAEAAAKKATETIKAWNTSGETFSTKIPAAILIAEMYGTFNLRMSTHSKTETKYGYDSKAKRYTIKPQTTEFPGLTVLSPWNVFPDPDSGNVQEGDGVVIQHIWSGARLRKEAKALGWDASVVDELLKDGPKFSDNTSTSQNPQAKFSRGDNSSDNKAKFSVLEFWGTVQAKDLTKAGIKVDEEIAPTEYDYVEACIFTCQGKVLWGSVNPYYPVPYRPTPVWHWDEVPESNWGVGVAESIRDHQKMLNGATRGFFDNVAFTANAMFEINEDALADNDDRTVYPGKVFVTRSGFTGEAVRQIPVADISGALLNIIQLTQSNIAQDSGVDNAQAGIGAPEDQKTATGVAVQKSNANDMYSSRLRRLDEVLEQILEWQARWYVEMRGGDDGIPLKLKANGLLKISTIKELAHNQLQTMMNVRTQAAALSPSLEEKIDWDEQTIRLLENMGFENVREDDEGETKEVDNPLSDERIMAALGITDPAQLPAILAQFAGGGTQAPSPAVAGEPGDAGAGGVMPQGMGGVQGAVG